MLDRALAYKLQKKYIKQANALEEEQKQYEQNQHHSSKNKPIKGPKPKNHEPEEPEEYVDYPEENMGGGMPNEEDELKVNNKPFKKEKKSFKEKMKCRIFFEFM